MVQWYFHHLVFPVQTITITVQMYESYFLFYLKGVSNQSSADAGSPYTLRNGMVLIIAQRGQNCKGKQNIILLKKSNIRMMVVNLLYSQNRRSI